MMPVIHVEDEVMEELKKRAVDLRLVFGTPNAVLKALLGLHKQDDIILDKFIDIEIKSSYTSLNWHVILIPKRNRRFFPGYKLPFLLETDIGEVKTHVSSAPKGTHIGDPDRGTYFQSRLKKWFDTHQTQITDGTILRIHALEPGKRYKLSIKNKSL